MLTRTLLKDNTKCAVSNALAYVLPTQEQHREDKTAREGGRKGAGYSLQIFPFYWSRCQI